jgi:hypothetical protein
MMFLFLALYAVQPFPRSWRRLLLHMKEPFAPHVKGFAREFCESGGGV